MKTKLEMAHEYALEMLKRGDPEWRIVTDAWNLADAMYLEKVERENIVCQDLSQEEWQPDWSQAPDDAVAWVYSNVDKSGFWCHKKPIRLSRGWCTSTMLKKSPSFNYQDHWKDSLRERPE